MSGHVAPSAGAQRTYARWVERHVLALSPDVLTLLWESFLLGLCVAHLEDAAPIPADVAAYLPAEERAQPANVVPFAARRLV